MNRHVIAILNASLIIALVFSAYISANNVPRNDQTEAADQEWPAENKDDVVLTIWSHKNSMEHEIQTFQAANPHITVELTSLESEPRISERFLNALAEGTAPDILALNHAMLGSINSVDLIADLSHSHLDLEAYHETMGDYLWSIHQSLDGQRTIALPYEAYPYVLFYRHDILEDHGYPAEPEELSKFLRDPDHWLQLAQDLKQNNQWILQWENDLLTIVNYGQFFFNRNIEYQRSSEFYRQVVDTAMKFKDHTANVSIWTPNGQDMLRNNQLVMVMMPSYGENLIAGWAPEQAGSWRVARLPLGAEAVDVNSSLSLAVTAHSPNKEAAEKFLEHVMNTSTTLNWLQSAPPNSYLGGQDSGDVYMDILKEISPNTVPTPLDDRLFDMWLDSVETYRQYNLPADDALEAATQDIMDIVSVAQKQLQQYMQRTPH